MKHLFVHAFISEVFCFAICSYLPEDAQMANLGVFMGQNEQKSLCFV